jgi:hypothetical protein
MLIYPGGGSLEKMTRKNDYLEKKSLSRAKGGGSVDFGCQRPEDRSQRTEDRGQRTEDRGQKNLPYPLTPLSAFFFST